MSYLPKGLGAKIMRGKINILKPMSILLTKGYEPSQDHLTPGDVKFWEPLGAGYKHMPIKSHIVEAEDEDVVIVDDVTWPKPTSFEADGCWIYQGDNLIAYFNFLATKGQNHEFILEMPKDGVFSMRR